MIDRYEDPLIKPILNDVRKHQEWLRVEIAVLRVRERLGQIAAGIAERVEKTCHIDEQVLALIKRREKATDHDLQAFVEVMWLQLILADKAMPTPLWNQVSDWTQEAKIRGGNGEVDEERFQALFDAALETPCPEAEAFHQGMTSYDTEEPATGLLLREAASAIISRVNDLAVALWARAQKHRGELLMGETHLQAAQPITFGVRILNWLEGLLVAASHLKEAKRDIAVMKLSGAVGMYGTFGPEVEDGVGAMLALQPVIATQIVGLGRKAHLALVLAEIATACQKIVHDLRLMAKWQVGEFREPFGKRQVGSTAMPHKKNPIISEQGEGMARIVRMNGLAVLENVVTDLERDIGHSCVERVALVDMFHALGHLLRRLTGVIRNMQVFPERMKENFDRAYGTWASQEVATFLRTRGMAAKTATNIAKLMSGEAMQTRIHLSEYLLVHPDVRPLIGDDGAALMKVFDVREWLAHEPDIYARFAARWNYQLS